MITSNKQRQEHNNLATTQRGKLKGANECFKNLQFVTLQNPNAEPSKIGQGGHGDHAKNGWKWELEETYTFIFKQIL